MSTQPLDALRYILQSEDDTLPRSKYQEPAIEIRKNAKRPYYFIRPYQPILTENGIERKQKTLKLAFVDEKIGKRELAERKAQLLAPINAGKTFIQAQLQFRGVLDRYVQVGLPLLGINTQGKYASHIDKHIRPAFYELRMCDIDRMAVGAFLRQKEAEGLSHWTMLDIRNIGSAVFTWAAENKLYSGENPWEHQKVKGAEAKQKVLPPAESLIRFLGALRDTAIISADGARLIVLTAIAAGTRVSEVLGLRSQDIDPQNETITISGRWSRGNYGPTKTAASRRTRQVPGLARELLRFAGDRPVDAWIFGRTDRAGNPPDDRDLQQHVFRPAAEAVGIYRPGFGMHYFRSLNISWRQEAGAHPIEAMKAAGHTSLNMTMLYTQTDADREREHVKAILGRLEMKAAGGVQ